MSERGRTATRASGSTTRCRCCRHEPPHCTCKLDRTPRVPPQPIVLPVTPCSLTRCYSLSEVAFILWRRLPPAVRQNHPGFTTAQISGAVRALALMNDRMLYATQMLGCVVRRQQTMVHRSKMKRLEAYVREHFT